MPIYVFFNTVHWPIMNPLLLIIKKNNILFHLFSTVTYW